MLIQRIYLISFLANRTIKKIEALPVSTTRHRKNLQNTTWTSLLQCLGIFYLFFLRKEVLERGGSPPASSASSSHLARMAFSLQAFLKLSCRFSKRQIVVWLNSEPCTAARASPTLVCV